MITVYHSCFSTTGPFPDRPLPYSQAPSGCVRLLSVGTMRQLRLPCLSCVTSFVALCRNTSGRFPAFARHRGEIAAPTPGCCLTGVTLCLPVSCPKDAFGSPKFPANPSCICPVLRLRPGLYARLSRRFGVVLAQQDGEDPSDALSKLNHTAFALAVYASCRPLGRRRKTRFRWLAKPFRVGFLIPTEFVRRVSAVASSLPGLILARLAPDLDLNLLRLEQEQDQDQD